MKICKTVLIAGSGILAESISRLFRRNGVYFGIFEAPENFSEEHGRFQNTIIKIANGVKLFRPETVLLAGCSENLKSQFRASLVGYHLKEIDVFSEEDFFNCSGFVPPNKRTEVNPRTPDSIISGDLVVFDPEDEITAATSKNLAVAMGAMLVALPNITREEADSLREYHYRWNSATDALTAQENRENLLSTMQARLGNIVHGNPSSITFITRGVPYGIIPFLVPVTHISNFPSLLGVNIARGLSKSFLNFPRTPLAILVAPDANVGAEIEDVRKILGEDAGYVLRTAMGNSATAYKVSMLTEYMPSDIIIFSSHAGEVDGSRVTSEFEHPPGKIRKLTYDSVHTFNLIPESENVHAIEFKRYVSFDGIRWPSSEGRKDPELRAAFGFYMSNIRNENFGKVVSKISTTSIRGSGVFKMADANYVPVMHECGGYNSPFVIANACSAWRETADRFVAAGASIFIGTTHDISDAIACVVLPALLKRICKGQTVGYALLEAQKTFVTDLGYTPYLMEGFIFATLSPEAPANRNAETVKSAMRNQLNSYRLGLESKEEELFKDRNQMVVTFFEEELKAFVRKQNN